MESVPTTYTCANPMPIRPEGPRDSFPKESFGLEDPFGKGFSEGVLWAFGKASSNAKGIPFPKGCLRGGKDSPRESRGPWEGHPLGKTNSFNQKQKHLLLNLKIAGFVIIWLASKEKRFAIQNL